jgi:molybdopterin converting factor small subunit
VSTVTVQLFASYAESFGEQSLQIPLAEGSTVRDLIGQLRQLRGSSCLPESPRIAVNRKFALADQRIGAGDEVALIPPVAGG